MWGLEEFEVVRSHQGFTNGTCVVEIGPRNEF